MRGVFADTFYFLALLDRNETAHKAAVAAAREPGRLFVTTEYVLVELGDALHQPPLRREFIAIGEGIAADPSFRVVPASTELFGRGKELFARRPDKEWSLTDCLSFIVMNDGGITDALTGDKHFTQAGFRALLV